MSLPVAFWDSSALLPLCAEQPVTPRARTLFANHEIAAWWSTPVEMMSGLSRLWRSGELDGAGYQDGKKIATSIASNWILVLPSSRVATQAILLLEAYPLRAADALQLAAALEWCEGRTKGRLFLTFDKRLTEAARAAGFTLG